MTFDEIAEIGGKEKPTIDNFKDRMTCLITAVRINPETGKPI